MKAKEYAQLINTPNDYVVVCLQLLKEWEILLEERHANTNRAVAAIGVELDNKWKAICRIKGFPDKTFLRKCAREYIPTLYSAMVVFGYWEAAPPLKEKP